MKLFNNSGRLIIPQLDKLKTLGEKVGIVTQRRKILVNRLYCPNGHSLIISDNPEFDGEPGIHLMCEGEKIRQSVYLSPFQGDYRKQYAKEFRIGEEIYLFCPECEVELPKVAPHNCQPEAKYVALFLDKDACFTYAVCICNIWGCPDSMLKLSGEIVAEVRTQMVHL